MQGHAKVIERGGTIRVDFAKGHCRIEVREDSECELTVTLPPGSRNVVLWVGNHPDKLPVSYPPRPSGEIRFRSSRERFFINCFGESAVRVTWESHDGAHAEELFVADVLATKITAERAAEMLKHIEGSMESVLAACFSKTAVSAGGDLSKPLESIWTRLALVTRSINTLMELTPRFQWRKLARLVPTSVVVENNDSVRIGEQTMGWLLENLDGLSPSVSTNSTAVRIRGRYYEPQLLLSEALQEDTDIYENRVLLGFCESLRVELQTIRRRVHSLVSALSTTPTVEGTRYVHFQQIGSIFARAFRARVDLRIDTMEAALSGLTAQLNAAIPVGIPLPEPPRLSPGFLRFEHYRQAFELANEWYSQGAVSFSAEAFLLGLKSLDRLFEFYCLVRLVEATQAMEFRLVGREYLGHVEFEDEFESRPADKYLFKRGDGEFLNIHYEPRIGPDLGAIELIDSYHRGRGPHSQWKPDFLLEFTADGRTRFAILDAKYQREQRAREQLPDMTLKYLHGISRPKQLAPAVDALCLLYAGKRTGRNSYYSYHAQPFGLLDNQAVRPAIGALQLAPGRGDELSTLLRKLTDLCLAGP